MSELCREWSRTSGFVGGRCGRPIKDRGMCGIHAAAEKRREENRARWDAEWAESNRVSALQNDFRAARQVLIRTIPLALESGNIDALRAAWDGYEEARRQLPAQE